MQGTTLQLSSRNKELSAQKLPIMHLIGNSWDSVVWSEFCVNSDTVPRLPRSSGVLKSSQRFSCVEIIGKKEISKLEGKRKMRYKNLNFPTTSDFQFDDSTAVLKRLPSRHPRCGCRYGSSPDIHALKPSVQSEGFGFFGVTGLQMYAGGSVVK